jgi:eukaryotic-like serine/threonine-protein kinase
LAFGLQLYSADMTTRALEVLATADVDVVTSALRPVPRQRIEREAGDALTSTLRLSRVLGEGGMGAVWQADWRPSEEEESRPVAVKLLRQVIAESAIARERFRREAEAAMRIESPHIVRVLTHGRSELDELFIVMELLEGETLGDRLEREVRLDLDATVAVVWQAGRAIAAAHALGIVHRDIKPDNLFLVRTECDPYVKVLDFGIAKDIQALDPSVTSTGAVVGTPAFMAPEQMVGAPVGPAVDVWSLGVVAYLSICGRLPFEGSSLASIAVAIERGDVSLPSAMRSDLPAWFDDWLMRALAPDPAQRYEDVAAMLAALERAQSGSPAVARPTPRRSSVDELEVASSMKIPGVGNPRSSTLNVTLDARALPRRRIATSWVVAAAAALSVFIGGSYLAQRDDGARASAAQGSLGGLASGAFARAAARVRAERVDGVAHKTPTDQKPAATASPAGRATFGQPAAPPARPRRKLGF